MDQNIVIAATGAMDLAPAPIAENWILSGNPEARSKVLATSADGTSFIMVWECTPGRFNWHYADDETVVLLAGEVFISNADGAERRCGPGDMLFFPAGSSATWRITNRVRKVAVLRHALPFPVGIGLRVWNKFLRVLGLRESSPSIVPALVNSTGN
jgi:hypothetical protein